MSGIKRLYYCLEEFRSKPKACEGCDQIASLILFFFLLDAMKIIKRKMKGKKKKEKRYKNKKPKKPCSGFNSSLINFSLLSLFLTTFYTVLASLANCYMLPDL